jgi:peptide-methionine (S)-S-oxide reductase
VVRTAVGYTGGTTESPDYHRIGDHSETLLVEFDPKKISYAELLKVFWASHDPESEPYLRQYRNALFIMNEEQQKAAEKSRKQMTEATRRPVYTAIEPAGTFYAAEDYHQKYLLRKSGSIYRELQAIYPDPEDFAASTAAARINGYLGCNGDRDQLVRELGQLGLTAQGQENLVERVTSSCSQMTGLTCPVGK